MEEAGELLQMGAASVLASDRFRNLCPPSPSNKARHRLRRGHVKSSANRILSSTLPACPCR